MHHIIHDQYYADNNVKNIMSAFYILYNLIFLYIYLVFRYFQNIL